MPGPIGHTVMYCYLLANLNVLDQDSCIAALAFRRKLLPESIMSNVPIAERLHECIFLKPLF